MINKGKFELFPSKEKISLFFFVICLFILCSLGGWQFLRHTSKTEYINDIINNLDTRSRDFNDIRSHNMHSKVYLEGSVDYINYFWLYRRHPLAKNIDGAYLVAPIFTKHGSYLSILGWYSNDKREEILKEISKMSSIKFDGIILESEKLSRLVPSNDYKKRILFTLNISDISNTESMDYGDFFIASINSNEIFKTKHIPITPTMMVNIKNDHLEYSATWFGLAIVLCIIYYLYIKKPKEKK